jgi:hypothetical protein
VIQVKFSDKISALQDAGFTIRYVERSEWTRYGTHDSDGWHESTTVRETCPAYISYSDVHGTPTEFPCRAYVDLSSIARGDDQAGQTTTTDRSNYRSLRREFPDMFTDTSYSNVDVLGAMIGNLSDEVIGIVCGLQTDYSTFDESDVSELESEEITESWDQYVSSDIGSEIRQAMSDEGDAWDALSDEAQRAMFWRAVETSESYPEHDGHDIRWTYDAIVTAIAAELGVFEFLTA